MKKKKLKRRVGRASLAQERALAEEKKRAARERNLAQMGFAGRLLAKMLKRRERMLATDNESRKLTLKKVLLFRFGRRGKELLDGPEKPGKDEKKKT